MAEDTTDWTRQYNDFRVQLEPLKDKLLELLRVLIEDAGIDVIQVEARVKNSASFTAKLARKAGKYADPLNEITDLVGLRVIAYYRDDLKNLEELIRENFEIDDGNTVMKGADYDPDRLGYRSDQYIATLKPNRATLREWERLPQVRWEIQVRTMLQHAWAAVDHKLYYKDAKDAPPEVRRRLFALSALFELADGEFAGIRDARESIVKNVEGELAVRNFDIPLDFTSLGLYLDGHEYPEQLREILEQQENLILKPNRQRRNGSSRSNLFSLFEYYGFKSLASLNIYLQDRIEPTLRAVGKFDLPPTYRYFFEDYLQDAVLLEKQVDRDKFLSLGYTEEEWTPFKVNLDKYLAGLDSV